MAVDLAKFIKSIYSDLENLDSKSWRAWQHATHPALYVLWLVRNKHVFGIYEPLDLTSRYADKDVIYEKHVIFKIIEQCDRHERVSGKLVFELVSHSTSAYRDIGYRLLIVLFGYKMDWGIFEDKSETTQLVHIQASYWLRLFDWGDMSFIWPIIFVQNSFDANSPELNSASIRLMLEKKKTPNFESAVMRIETTKLMILEQHRVHFHPVVRNQYIYECFNNYTNRVSYAKKYWEHYRSIESD